MEHSETSFCELRRKEVVNCADGKKLGRIVDLIISVNPNCVQGIVVPLGKFNLFSKQQNIFIPFNCIEKIGEDIIIVDIISDSEGNLLCKTKDKPGHHHKDDDKSGDKKSDKPHYGCDHCCESCNKYDCEDRWSYEH